MNCHSALEKEADTLIPTLCGDLPRQLPGQTDKAAPDLPLLAMMDLLEGDVVQRIAASRSRNYRPAGNTRE
jgi:hypothetical protein